MRANHHALLAPRQHNIRPSLVLHEPWTRSPDDRDNDVVFFVALEGVDEIGRASCRERVLVAV